MKKTSIAVAVMLIACGTSESNETNTAFKVPPVVCDYPQAFGNASHTGIACPELNNMTVVATIVQDPDADAENAFSGFLQIHESPPLTLGDFVVVPSKHGYVDSFDRSPEHYSVQTLRWVPNVSAPGALLVPAWNLDTDWQPVDGVIKSFGYVTNGYVQSFGPALANGSVYMPARDGKLIRADISTGHVIATINPFAGTPFNGDERTIVNNMLSVDAAGNVLYDVVAWPTGTPNRSAQPRGSWIVRVHPNNSVELVDFATIASASIGVPQLTSLCEYRFRTGGTPAATGPDSRPPMFGCGTQRPAINSPIAIDPNTGNLVIFSLANNAQGAAFVIEASGTTFAPIRASDTRGHFLHGCGVRLADSFVGGSGTSCDTITAGLTVNIGNDPDFNGPVRFLGEDLMDSAVAIAPNGDRSIGSYDGGFSFGGGYDARGAGVVFHSDGSFAAKNETFWWEVTPSVWRQSPLEFHYLQDRQLYSDFELTVGQYDPAENLEATNSIPLTFDPVAIDWLDAHIVFGPGGDRYATNGDGHLYKFIPGRELPTEAVELQNADGSVRSMETLSGYYARDRAGRIYASFAGNVYVIASSVTAPPVPRPVPRATRNQLVLGRQAKVAGVAMTPMPEPPN